jgi:hypothetical protein
MENNNNKLVNEINNILRAMSNEELNNIVIESLPSVSTLIEEEKNYRYCPAEGTYWISQLDNDTMVVTNLLSFNEITKTYSANSIAFSTNSGFVKFQSIIRLADIKRKYIQLDKEDYNEIVELYNKANEDTLALREKYVHTVSKYI